MNSALQSSFTSVSSFIQVSFCCLLFFPHNQLFDNLFYPFAHIQENIFYILPREDPGVRTEQGCLSFCIVYFLNHKTNNSQLGCSGTLGCCESPLPNWSSFFLLTVWALFEELSICLSLSSCSSLPTIATHPCGRRGKHCN